MGIFSFGRPAYTLLYVTVDKTYRIDADRKGVISGTLETIKVACESPGGLPYCLETILKQSNQLGRKLWVFYAELNTYTLSLPSIQVEGVSEEILEQALQFEYEALTGNSAMKSQLAYRFIGEEDEMSHYWINVIAKEILIKLIGITKKAGSKFAGLLHPGGLPELLSETETKPASWLRIECWSSVLYMLADKPDTGLNLQVIPLLNNANWPDELQHWLQEIGRVEKSEAIMAFAIEYLPETDQIYHFVQTDELLFWMGGWAKHLAVNFTNDVPILHVRKKVNQDLLYMLGGGTVAFLLCSAHLTWNLYQQNQYEYEYESLKKVEKEMADMRKIIVSNQDKTRKLKTQLADLGGNISIIPYAIAALQKRPAELLFRLAVGNPEDLIIEQISENGDQMIISGVALYPYLPNELAENIEVEFSKVSWQVTPPTKKDMDVFEQGGPWTFNIVLDDLGLLGFAKE